jgi:hypothetical protein
MLLLLLLLLLEVAHMEGHELTTLSPHLSTKEVPFEQKLIGASPHALATNSVQNSSKEKNPQWGSE